jgi:4'-phosphopantetheinyl transferase
MNGLRSRSPANRRVDGFLRYWTRKEAVLKATGDGLRVPMDELVVSAPEEAAELRSWRGRPDRRSASR